MAQTLPQLDPNVEHTFLVPVKKINEGQDVPTFLTSKAYRDITLFLVQLNRSMVPRPPPPRDEDQSKFEEYPTVILNTSFMLHRLLRDLEKMVDEVPLDPAPQRFGNPAFRTWCQTLESKSVGLLSKYLPQSIVSFPHTTDIDAITELRAYLVGAFGSSQRLDYGTGHELSFLAFLAGIWKLGGFPSDSNPTEVRGIVGAVISLYLILVRKLILKYSLEPAGSHGVWGLDDHSFLPYIFGSAQYSPIITESDPTPVEGSNPDAPDPGIVTQGHLVEKLRHKNLYFGAIAFIYDVKKGPFWEHSPTLYDISGVRAGWAKINKGMLKMYDAEVLSKFPVVQHFPFGSLFSWDRDPAAKIPVTTAHVSSQPTMSSIPTSSSSAGLPDRMQAPWASSRRNEPRLQTLSRVLPPIKQPASAGQFGIPQRPIGAEVPGMVTAEVTSTVGHEDPKEKAVNMPPPPLTKAPWAK